MSLHIYSGKCEHGKCGTHSDIVDAAGEKLSVGDIVMIASLYETTKDVSHLCGLTAVVEDRPELDGHANQGRPYVMGLRDADLGPDGGWYIKRVKKWSDVLPGEKWTDYGFNYQEGGQP